MGEHATANLRVQQDCPQRLVPEANRHHCAREAAGCQGHQPQGQGHHRGVNCLTAKQLGGSGRSSFFLSVSLAIASGNELGFFIALFSGCLLRAPDKGKKGTRDRGRRNKLHAHQTKKRHHHQPAFILPYYLNTSEKVDEWNETEQRDKERLQIRSVTDEESTRGGKGGDFQRRVEECGCGCPMSWLCWCVRISSSLETWTNYAQFHMDLGQVLYVATGITTLFGHCSLSTVRLDLDCSQKSVISLEL